MTNAVGVNGKYYWHPLSRRLHAEISEKNWVSNWKRRKKSFLFDKGKKDKKPSKKDRSENFIIL